MGGPKRSILEQDLLKSPIRPGVSTFMNENLNPISQIGFKCFYRALELLKSCVLFLVRNNV